MVGSFGGWCAIAVAGLVVFATSANAQVLYGSLVGSVSDDSNARVPDAMVTVTHKETGATRTSMTNAQGQFSIPTLQSGSYEVRVSRDGFRTASRTDVEVTVNDVTRVDFALQVGQVSETVTVAATAVGLQTDRAEVRGQIGTRRLTNLPVPGQRNYQALLVTIPGISPPGTPHSIPSNPSRAMSFNVNGANTAANNTRIDGASATNIWLPHVASYVPALESIEEVNVVSNSMDAEQGLAGGASINVTIRSGTNELHGAGFWYHQGNWSQARNFFLPQNQDIPKFVYNQPGARLGGPIVRNKLFYFASYEATLDRRFAGRFSSVPTAAMRRGDLSDSSTVIYDPATGSADGTGRRPFPGNIIPENRIHPLSRRLMGMLPLPNVPGAENSPTENFFATAPFTFDRHTIDSKVNYNITDKWTSWARLSWLKFETLNQTEYGDLGGRPIGGGNPGFGFGGTWSGTLATTYAATPTFLIDGHFGYTLMDTNVQQFGLEQNIGRDVLGIPGTNGTRQFEGGLPGFGISGFQAFGLTENYMPYFRHDPQYQYVANANWLKGSHNIRFGMDIYRLHLNHTQPEFTSAGGASAAGRLDFGQGPTQLREPGNRISRGSQYNGMGTFLLGLVTGGGRLLQVPDEYTARTTQYSFYVRDQWQTTRNLTLSLGVRIEHFPMPTRADRGMERYDFATNQMLVCGTGGIPKDCGTSAGGPYFSPRIGLAYRLGQKTVVRSGFGWNWDPWNLARPLRTNFPILAVMNLAPPALQWGTDLTRGLPPIPVPEVGSDGRIDVPLNYAVNTTDDKYKRGYMLNWNFTIQRELPANLNFQAGYVATRAIHVPGILDLNAGQIPGADREGQPLFQRFGRRVNTNLVTAVGHTTYNSLQAQLSRRFSNGFQANVAYTWSKTIGICCNSDNNGDPQINALAFFHLNRAVMPWDRTHNLQITAAWELPFGKGRALQTGNGFADFLIGGWQLNTLTSFMTGTPFTVSSDGGSLQMPNNNQRADQVKAEVRRLGGIGRGNAYYDPFAFERVTDPRFGTAGYNSLRGPNFFNTDLGLFRTFRAGERFTLQFRAEAFNWTNTPKFNNPSGGIQGRQVNSDGTFRTGVFEITGTNSGGREPNGDRILRLGLRLAF